MKEVLEFLSQYPYITYAGTVVALTAGVRYSIFSNVKLGPKWVTLLVGTLLAIAFFTMHWIDLNTPHEFMYLLGSLGLATAFYDYAVKVIIDVIRRKNPFKE